MTIHRKGVVALLALAAGAPSLAQQSQQAAPPPANAGDQLTEIVVTATRREDTIQQIPISVSAVSQQELSDRGLKTAQDLVQSVTSLHISPNNGGSVAGTISNPDVSIRGIRSTTGAPTTGIYIDDVPLQQRNGAQGLGGGGTVFPQLFDLERVEVLRGPQGTLYGGSSEGGTVRFITPQPSFSEPSFNARVEGSSTQYGDPNAEGGVTVGGPLVNDVLAVRVSGWYRHDGGYVDHVSQYTGNVLPGGSNTNSEDHRALHAAVAYKPIEDLTLTASYVIFRNEFRDSDEYWASIPQYKSLLGTFPPGPGTLYTYCPCDFGPYKSGQNTNIGKNFYTSDAQLSPLLSQGSNSLSLPSLTVDYSVGPVSIKSVTAFAQTNDDSYPNFSFVDPASRSVTPLEEPYNALPNNGPYIATLEDYSSTFAQHNHLTSITEELRASSNRLDSRFSWVGGFFYDYTKEYSSGVIEANTGDLGAAALFGFPSAAAAPPPVAAGFAPLNGLGLIEAQNFNERQEALFGEVTFKVTDALRLTAGARVTRDEFNYHLAQGGALFGYPPGVVLPVADGSVTQTPVTPKGGVQYVVDQNLNFYANASKGFRPGGVNQAIPLSTCQTSLNQAGYPEGAPSTYGSDSLWSYELGSKWRTWDGRATIQASAFYINWADVQTPITLQCGQSFTVSTGKAISKGGDLQAAILLFRGFTLTAAAAYTDARYADAVIAGPALLIGKGDELPYTPKWSGNLSGEYKFQVAALQSFVRMDWGYQGNFVQGQGPGTSSYLPDAYRLPGDRLVNARAGFKVGKASVELFVQNLTNSQDLQSLNGMASGPGRVSCFTAACGPGQYFEYAQGAVLSTYRPRTAGVDLEYRY